MDFDPSTAQPAQAPAPKKGFDPTTAKRFDPGSAKPVPQAGKPETKPEENPGLLSRLFGGKGDTLDPRPESTRKSLFANMKDEGLIDSPNAPAPILASKAPLKKKIEAAAGVGYGPGEIGEGANVVGSKIAQRLFGKAAPEVESAAPKAAPRPGETIVAVPDKLRSDLGMGDQHVVADYAKLHEKHGEYFDSPEDVKRHVEFVAQDPQHVLPGNQPGHVVLVRPDGKNRLIAVDTELYDGKYSVRSAYFIKDRQLKSMLKKGEGLPAPGRQEPRESGLSRSSPALAERVQPAEANNIGDGSALSKAPGLTEPRILEDQLFQLQQQGRADKLEVIKNLKDVPEGIPAETWEKLYHHEESPKTVALTPEEQALYDKHVKPIAAEADRLSVELERMGYPVDKVETGARAKKIEAQQKELDETPKAERLPSSEGYTPRYVAGRTRSFGEVLHQWKRGVEAKFGGAPGRSMRKTVDAQNSRRYYLAADSAGNKQVVYVAPGGDVIPFSVDTKTGKSILEKDLEPLGKVQGRLGPGAKVKAGDEEFTLENATTKQIEDVATTRYHKNVLANRLDNLTKLRSAARNAKFIDAMKASPDWDKIAIKVDEAAEVPKGEDGREWRVPKGPLQFRGYYMEPRVADALEDFASGNRNLEGTVEGLDKAASVIKGSIFWWPLPHMLNTLDHYITAGGLVGNVKGIGSAAVRAFKGEARDIPLVKAIRAVATQNDDYMAALKAGASLPYAEIMTRDLHKALITKLGEAVKTEPKQMENISKAFGYVNPIAMIKGIYGASSKALWASTDAMNLAKIFAEQQGGKTLGQAIKSAEEHMPNYRIPGQVMGTRLASQILRNPLFTMFGRYQYNRLASYGHMVNALVSKLPAKDKAEALDKLAMLGFMLFVAYPAIDDGLKKVTHNPDASFRRPGASAVPQALMDVVKGDKTPPEGASSVFSLGPLFDTTQELYHGTYGYSGQPVLRMSDLERGDKQFLYDLFAWIGSKIQPVGMASSVTQGKQTPSQILESLFNVKDPNPNQKRMKEYYKRRDDQAARRRDIREERKREAAQ